jgi:hypothetical protein
MAIEQRTENHRFICKCGWIGTDTAYDQGVAVCPLCCGSIVLYQAENEELRWSIMLARSLRRLHEAIKECARIGFEESSPTRNAHHASVWLNLNEAQKDAALKLDAYSKVRNAVLAEKIRSDPDDEPTAGNVP